MDDNLTKIVIAVVAAIGGGGLSILGGMYSARQKTKELELTNRHKIQEAQRANAREFLESVYIPIQIMVAKLERAYEELVPFVDKKWIVSEAERTERFRAAARTFISAWDALAIVGHEDYLTPDLNASIRDFVAFLRASETSRKALYKTTLRLRTSVPFAAGTVGTVEFEASRLRLPKIESMRFLGIGVDHVEQLIAAPIPSLAFDSHFRASIDRLKEQSNTLRLARDRPAAFNPVPASS